MTSDVRCLHDLDATDLARAGGKAANLGELVRISGISVPAGVCVTTDAFARVVGDLPSIRERLEALSRLQTGDRDAIRAQSAELRRTIEGLALPAGLRAELHAAVVALGEHGPFAVRSSATAEDLPTASFAGQQDTYLNVIGIDEIARHVVRCWASLFTERAVAYRVQHGFDHRRVRLAVVVQRMVDASAAGVLFTADPATSNRTVSSIDAAFGLGEALVAGHVNPDLYRVRAGTIVEKHVRQSRPVLTDAQILELEQIGRTIEAHFGRPQDIEWCLAGDAFQIVQSRPITTLFPIPEPRDHENHVYISVGHGQMMTDAMKPLGLSLFRMIAMTPMCAAGGRLFVDVTRGLASPARENLLNVLGTGDPLLRAALETLLARGDFLPAAAPAAPAPTTIRSHQGMTADEIAAAVGADPRAVETLIAERERSLVELATAIAGVHGPALFELLVEDIARSKALLGAPNNMAAVMAGINASGWINEHVRVWLGEKNVADTVARSLPANITSEMGAALLDIADAIRPSPAVIAHLARATDEDLLDGLLALPGGREARAAIDAFLDRYGMRGAGEIDITRDRWAETPTTLVPLVLGTIKTAAPGEGRAIAAQRRADARAATQAIVERLRALPDGAARAADTERMIALVHAFMGYREYPKYHLVARLFVYKQALLREADALVRAHVIDRRDDIYYLAFQELHEAVRAQHVDRALVAARRAEHRTFEKLAPPRVITSDGELVTGAYKRSDLPAGALIGLAVSSGVVEGRARVVHAIEDADFEEGDILVTTFTDPSWTPAFVSIKGLVTEVGGLMTHGAVIAREYGLPAVVGVEDATRRIRDGQRIRLNGSDGYVELR